MEEAYQRGDRAVLAGVIDETWREIWALGRDGFTSEDEGRPVHVAPSDDLDQLERVTIEVLSQGLSPARRAETHDRGALRAALLTEARRRYAEAQARRGQVLGGPAAPTPEAESWDLAQLEHHSAAAREAALALLGPRAAGIVAARFERGEPAASVGQGLGVGPASIRAVENRARRALARALRPQKFGPATLDAIFAGHLQKPPPGITQERIKSRVLSRVEVTQARPYAARLTEALLFSALAAALYGLLYFGVLPGPDGDLRVEPRVELECKPACTSGSAATVHLLAPRPSDQVALYLVTNAEVEPLLVSPGGGGLRIPLVARDRPTALPYPVTLPKDLSAETRVVAVLSQERLSAWTWSRAALGGVPKTIVATAEVR